MSTQCTSDKLGDKWDPHLLRMERYIYGTLSHHDIVDDVERVKALICEYSEDNPTEEEKVAPGYVPKEHPEYPKDDKSDEYIRYAKASVVYIKLHHGFYDARNMDFPHYIAVERQLQPMMEAYRAHREERGSPLPPVRPPS
jgi:hypothetical protein